MLKCRKVIWKSKYNQYRIKKKLTAKTFHETELIIRNKKMYALTNKKRPQFPIIQLDGIFVQVSNDLNHCKWLVKHHFHVEVRNLFHDKHLTMQINLNFGKSILYVRIFRLAKMYFWFVWIHEKITRFVKSIHRKVQLNEKLSIQ